MSAVDLYAEAVAALEAGLSVVPPAEDGTKQPITAWKLYQTRRPTAGQIATWYRDNERSGIGYVLGAISGNRECLEFDCPETWQAFRDTAEACGLDTVVERIVDGYCDNTPGGGKHLLYQCDEVAGNTQLARRPKRLEEMEHPNDKVKVKIETRGEGGYLVSAPSNGRVHPSGRPYVRQSGSVDTIASITPAERTDLFTLARAFDEMPRPDPHESRSRASTPGDRPGDIFATQTDWPEILEPHSWMAVYRRGDETYWRRPGKNRGISATTNYRGSDLLFVFTSSSLFEPERSYTKFGAYALLNHGGDYAAAARDLKAKGYGARGPQENSSDSSETSPSPDPAPLPVPPFPIDVLPPAVKAFVEDGAAALGVPPDLIAVPLMVCAGATIGRTRRIVLKPGFEQRPILNAAPVAPPGSAKSPALNLARHPLDVLQTEAVETFELALADYERELADWTKTEPGRRGQKPRRPLLAHFFTTDATLEALAPIAKFSPGVAVIRDELVSWVKSCDAYRGGRGGDRQAYLSLWAGAPLKIDRMSRDPLYVPEPTVCVVGGIQPEMLPELNEEAGRRDGFIERILWSYPETPSAQWSEAVVSESVKHGVVDLFRKLRCSPRDGDNGTTNLSREARQEWVRWYNENQCRIAAASGLAAGIYSKLPNQAARLALILHCLWMPDDPAKLVSGQRMADAVDLVEYFRDHAHRVLPHFGATAPGGIAGLMARVLRILDRAEMPWVDRSTIHRKLGGHVGAADLTHALDQLEADGLAARDILLTKTKPRERWRSTKRTNEKYEESPDADDDSSDYSYEESPEPGDSTEATANSSYFSFVRTDSSPALNIDPEIAEAVERLLALSPEELAQWRAEVAAAPDDDPYLEYDRAVLATVDAILADRDRTHAGAAA